MDKDIVERIADRIEERIGPIFGSPEYLADPVKLARAEKRRRESAETYAKLAYDEATAEILALRERLAEVEGMREQGQREGKAAVVLWLRERLSMKPTPPLAEAAAMLADMFERSELPCTILQPSTKESGE